MSDTIVNILSRLGLLGLAKGATAAAQATVTTVDADHNALDVSVRGTPALPADAATATLQTTGNTSAATTATQTTTTATNTGTIAGAVNSGAMVVKGTAATGVAVAGSPVYVAGIDGGGLVRPLLVSAAGNVQTAPAKGTTVSSSAAEASHVISASACLVAKIRGYNGNAGVRYFQGHNASSLPGNGAVPSVVSEQATSAHAQEVNFAIPTDRFSTGCVVATSSTGATLTIGAADATFTVDLYPANA